MNNKIVLFDGTNLDAFVNVKDGSPVIWEVKDGIATVTKHDITSKYEFSDAHIHVEFRIPDMPDKMGQDKGNSGVYVQGCYEVQVLDSYGVGSPRKDDCGAVYEKAAPIVNACLPATEWQTYDIILKSAKLSDDGSIEKNAVITVIQNGQVIHNNLELPSNTPGGVYERVVNKGPLMLQDHDCPVSYRNIWVQPLD